MARLIDAPGSPVVSANWLREALGSDNLAVIDASWRLAKAEQPTPRPAVEDYRRRHIPGAVFFDIDAIADRSCALPHMLPGAAQFSTAVGKLGITNDHIVIVYDDAGLFSAARVWWTFKVMGHASVAILDGGLPNWTAEGGDTTNASSSMAPTKYVARLNSKLVADADAVRDSLQSSTQILDARPNDRFHGDAPEPRPGLFSGSMPATLNLPASTLTTEKGLLKTSADLAQLFEQAGVKPGPLITTCGSGITAACLFLAAELIGKTNIALYDGSWAEWGNTRNDPLLFPVVARV